MNNGILEIPIIQENWKKWYLWGGTCPLNIHQVIFFHLFYESIHQGVQWNRCLLPIPQEVITLSFSVDTNIYR